MIVLESRELVILTPPHTASGNLQRALCTPEIGGQIVLGENPARTVDHHNVLVPPVWKDFRRALVVRHPLSRLIGLWMHCVDRWFADLRLRGMAEAWGQADKLRFGY